MDRGGSSAWAAWAGCLQAGGAIRTIIHRKGARPMFAIRENNSTVWKELLGGLRRKRFLTPLSPPLSFRYLLE